MNSLTPETLTYITNLTQKLHVLYVEDNNDARETTLRMLHNYFEHIVVASDGKDGLEQFKTNQFDVVFTDLDMPKIDGISMITEIRKENRKIPIIILSAQNDSEFLIETINLGINGYLLKPYTLMQIFSSIKKILLILDLDKSTTHLIELGGDYFFDTQQNVLVKNNHIIHLTSNERKLLELFISEQNTYVNTNIIENFLFNDQIHESSRIRSLLSRLRKKLDYDLIESNYGLGYRLKKPESV